MLVVLKGRKLHWALLALAHNAHRPSERQTAKPWLPFRPVCCCLLSAWKFPWELEGAVAEAPGRAGELAFLRLEITASEAIQARAILLACALTIAQSGFPESPGNNWKLLWSGVEEASRPYSGAGLTSYHPMEGSPWVPGGDRGAGAGVGGERHEAGEGSSSQQESG